MPPANSRNPSPPAQPSPSYLSALRELEPINQDVLNLAATLTTQAEDGDDAGLRYLRYENDHRDRLRRVMNRLNRLHNPPSAYSDHIPNTNSLYDWSPANEANLADDEEELDQILAELRQTDRDARMRAYSSNSLRSAAILQSVRRHPRFSARTREYLQRYNAERDAQTRAQQHTESRERHTEHARQQAMQRLAERQPSRTSGSTPAPSSPSSSPLPMLEQTIKYLSRIRHSNNLDDSLHCALDAGFLSKDYFDDFCDSHADFILDTYTLPPPAETSWLSPGAVLRGHQHATTINSTITTTSHSASTTLYRFRNNDSMTSTLLEPPSRPWMSSTRRSSPSGAEIVTSHSPQQDRWPVTVTIHAVDWTKMSVSATMEAYNVPSHPHAHQSLLTTSLDALSQPVTRTSSITTYLEGEILDFNTHTLLTESFKKIKLSASTDATYWKKMPPFQKYTDEELVRNLTSRRWYEEVLSKDWILMRWKEQCFVKSLNRSTGSPGQTASSFSHSMPGVSTRGTMNQSFQSGLARESHPDGEVHYWGSGDAEQSLFDDSGCGLTISGFYYVCLRREDGRLEGLYYDPQSSPYQRLNLESVRGGIFPAWGFR
ncbi:hypothetical protein BS50DRAFT_491513 [Corynespora cassiicola Philippines]|uniref:Vacuolar import and degradation protein-domain-containing protein n=1 Tax=Corynespora cassiicola Philippines TaxID=1448308 RepID=A0A2T2NR65_CORCC|nr:hypothetical protein BS50DRAFT_491513 [Corynespora cassiicola Philippines]